MNIHNSSFYPRPHVDSCGIKMELIPEHRNYPSVFYPLVRALFASRRKIIKNNLHDFLASRLNTFIEGINSTDEIGGEILARNKLSGKERAESLGLHTFLSLAQTVEDMRILQ